MMESKFTTRDESVNMIIDYNAMIQTAIDSLDKNKTNEHLVEITRITTTPLVDILFDFIQFLNNSQHIHLKVFQNFINIFVKRYSNIVFFLLSLLRHPSRIINPEKIDLHIIKLARDSTNAMMSDLYIRSTPEFRKLSESSIKLLSDVIFSVFKQDSQDKPIILRKPIDTDYSDENDDEYVR